MTMIELRTERRPAGALRSRAARYDRTTRRAPWLLALPACVLCFGLLLVPSLFGAGYAFTDWDGITSAHWVGLANFHELVGQRDGVAVLTHTVVLALAYVLGVNVAGLGLALALQNTLKTRAFLRGLFFVPVVVSPLVVSYIWKFMLDAQGSINDLLSDVGLAGLRQPWLGKPQTALACIVVVMIWQYAGYHMLIYTAGLQGVQGELHEAAAVDGARSWRRFRDITLPLLRPTITISLTLSTITALTVFDQVMALTAGGPAGSTDTLGTYVYEQAFVNGRYGYSAAVAVVLVVFVALVAVVQVRALRSRGR